MNININVYHGTDVGLVLNPDKPLYVTPDPGYNYIREKDVIYCGTFMPSNPFFTDNVQNIERLRSSPEDTALIKALGYDSVMYVSPSNLSRGASGWGGDSAQVVVLDHRCISGFQKIKKSDITPPGKEVLREHTPIVYNASPNAFSQFKHSNDIGFHFGTLKAAQDRLRALSGKGTLHLDSLSLSDTEKWRLDHLHNQKPGPQGVLLQLFAKKLSHPKSNLDSVVASLPEQEVHELIVEYNKKNDWAGLTDLLNKSKAECLHTVYDGNTPIAQTTNLQQAKRIMQYHGTHYLKKAHLWMSTPLELPDLGLWSPLDILKHIPGHKSELRHFHPISDEFKKYDFVKNVLLSSGYDGITYINEVENQGKRSFIALDSSQIMTFGSPLPKTKETPSLQNEIKRRHKI
jgi:hypothetical protein